MIHCAETLSKWAILIIGGKSIFLFFYGGRYVLLHIESTSHRYYVSIIIYNNYITIVLKKKNQVEEEIKEIKLKILENVFIPKSIHLLNWPQFQNLLNGALYTEQWTLTKDWHSITRSVFFVFLVQKDNMEWINIFEIWDDKCFESASRGQKKIKKIIIWYFFVAFYRNNVQNQFMVSPI